jgi:glutamine cyclotransferase
MRSMPRFRFAVLLLLFCAVPAYFTQASGWAKNKAPDEFTYAVVQSFPHDQNAFTQGLAWYHGFLYEGTGLEGRSSLRKVRLTTGEVLQQVNLAPEYFGEGITVLKDRILQLTWKAKTGFIYSASDFRLLRQFTYPGEGWGLANDGTNVYMSDGSADIRVLDGNTLKEKHRLHVHDGNRPVKELNELEFVEGELFANVWHTDRIARISLQTGEVLGWIDLTGILGAPFRRDNPEAVLNGIAYDAAGKRLFVTGKLWPRIFEIRLVPKK